MAQSTSLVWHTVLTVPRCAEPSERAAHSLEALTQLARVLTLDVLVGSLKDPAAALRWLAVDGQAVMTQETRRELMRQVNDLKQQSEQQTAAAAAQWARAKTEVPQTGGTAPATKRPQPPPARKPKVKAVAAVNGNTAAPGGGAMNAVTQFLRCALQEQPDALPHTLIHP